MDVGNVIVSFLPLLFFGILLLILYRSAQRKMIITVYLIAAVKPEFPNNIEIRASTEKTEIDEWEKTFWKSGLRVTRKTEELNVRRRGTNVKST